MRAVNPASGEVYGAEFARASRAELEAMATEVAGEAGALASLLQLQCAFVPYKAHEPAAYASSVSALASAFTAPQAKGYLFADGQWYAPAAALASSLEQVR